MPVARSTRSGGTTGQLRYLLQVEGQVRRSGGLGCEAVEGIRTREQSPEADVCGSLPRKCGVEGGHRKKALRPAERRELVTHLVTVTRLPVQRACRSGGLNCKGSRIERRCAFAAGEEHGSSVSYTAW